MKIEKLIIEIDTKGAISIKAEGFEGKKCLSVTEDLEKKLGTVITKKITKNTNNIITKIDNSQSIKS